MLILMDFNFLGFAADAGKRSRATPWEVTADKSKYMSYLT